MDLLALVTETEGLLGIGWERLADALPGKTGRQWPVSMACRRLACGRQYYFRKDYSIWSEMVDSFAVGTAEISWAGYPRGGSSLAVKSMAP
jgi:hypothetical protein